MEEEMKSDPKALVNEIEHVLWAAEHPMMVVDKTVLGLLRRCEVVLRTLSEQPSTQDI